MWTSNFMTQLVIEPHYEGKFYTFRSVPKCLGHFGTCAKMSHGQFGTGAEVSGHFGTGAEVSWCRSVRTTKLANRCQSDRPVHI